MYTLKKGTFTVGMRKDDKSYVIGFKNVVHARSVHYNMSLEPKFELVKQDPIYKGGINAYLASTIFIPKTKSNFDSELYLEMMHAEEFYRLPFSGVNIILPYDLVYEDWSEYIFRAHVLEAADGESMYGMMPL